MTDEIGRFKLLISNCISMLHVLAPCQWGSDLDFHLTKLKIILFLEKADKRTANSNYSMMKRPCFTKLAISPLIMVRF